MATFFNSVKVGYWVSVDLYGSLYGDVSRSGNTVTLSNMRFDMWPTGSAWGTGDFTLTVNGTSTTWSVSSGSLSQAVVNNTSFTVGTSSTSAQVGWSTSDGESGSFTVTFPSGEQPPLGLSCSNVVRGTRSFSATVSITSWNGLGDATTRYRELQAWVGDMSGELRFQTVVGSALSGTITVSNSSGGSATLTPNTQYTLGVYASNGTYATGSQRVGNFTTLPLATTFELAGTDNDSATVTWTTQADGGYYAKTLEYSLDGGTTWNTITTVSGGSSQNGSYTITGLSAGTSYTLTLRTRTNAGSTASPSISFIAGNINRYGSVDGQAKKIVKRYGSVGGQSKLIVKRYGSVSGMTKLI